MSTCKLCGDEISWTKSPEGKSIPINTDGSPHKCKTFLQQKTGILISHYPTGCTVRMENGDKVYALKNPLPKDIALPQNIDFAIDKHGFVVSYQLRGKANDITQEKPASTFTPASAVKGTTNPTTAQETPPCTTAAPAAKETEKPNTARPSPSPAAKDEARQDPAWLKHDDKEVWLRYIATLNTATAILEGVWQPDPAKTQAENIADKIEWVQTIAAGLRKRYEKEAGGA